MKSHRCWQEGPPVSLCVTAKVKKSHAAMYLHNVIKRTDSVVLYVHQLVQHCSIYNQVQGLQNSPQHRAFYSHLYQFV